MSGAARLMVPDTAARDRLLDRLPYRRLILSARKDIWCLVDADDFSWIVERNYNYGWHRNTRWKFYAKRNVGQARSTVYLHREILLRADPRSVEELVELHGDHRNGQSLDNRKANLRWLTAAENRAHITPRVQVPTLDQIIRTLARQAAPARGGDIPF